ncbi:MAG: CbiX/SirB N-terminal domain-containing protein, partial [bacterium]
MAEGSAVLLVSHGSPEKESNEQVLKLRDRLRAIRRGWRVEAAFLEREHPSFHDVLLDLLAEGISMIAVLPVFLFPGRHTSEDIPAEIADAHRKRPQAKIVLGPPLSEYVDLAEMLAAKIPPGAVATNPPRVILAAAGAVAIENRRTLEELVAKVQRRAGASARYAYLDHGEPLIEEVFREAAIEKPPAVVILPCILFPGMY